MSSRLDGVAAGQLVAVTVTGTAALLATLTLDTVGTVLVGGAIGLTWLIGAAIDPKRTDMLWLLFVGSFLLLPFGELRVTAGDLSVPLAAGVAVLVMAAMLARLLIARDAGPVDRRMLVALAVLLVGHGLSVSVSWYPEIGLWLWAKWVFHAVLFLFVASLRDRRWHLRVLLALVIVTGVLSTYATVEFFVDAGYDINFYRGVGTRSATGLHVALVLPLAVALALTRDLRWGTRSVMWVCVTPLLTALTFTYHRAGWVAALAGFLVLGLKRHRLVTVSLLGLGFVFLAYLGPSEVQARFWSIFTIRETGDPAVTNSLRLRLQWLGLQVIGEHPLLGVGLGNFVARLPWDVRYYEIRNVNLPHNFYISVWAEGGVLAFAGFIATGYLVLQGLVRGLSGAPTGAAERILSGLLGSLVALATFLLFSDDFNNTVVWTVLGLAAAAGRLWREEGAGGGRTTAGGVAPSPPRDEAAGA